MLRVCDCVSVCVSMYPPSKERTASPWHMGVVVNSRYPYWEIEIKRSRSNTLMKKVTVAPCYLLVKWDCTEIGLHTFLVTITILRPVSHWKVFFEKLLSKVYCRKSQNRRYSFCESDSRKWQAVDIRKSLAKVDFRRQLSEETFQCERGLNVQR